MASIATAIESPCTQVCVVHPTLKLCIGCGRSLDEIANWINFDGAERARHHGAIAIAACGDVRRGQRSGESVGKSRCAHAC